MRGAAFRTAAFVVAILAARAAGAQTCVRIDETSDMLAPAERTAARLLLQKTIEQTGQRVVDTGCTTTYTLSHIRLGETIVVILTTPAGSREGRALGLDDLPAVYSQLVRSITTGAPMGSLAVLDRTNVSAVQDLPARRVASDGFWHARVGYASLFGPSRDGAASFGFGYRAAFDRLGLDMSFLNFTMSDSGSYYRDGQSLVTLIKLEGLYYVRPAANRSAYAGGGLSYGRATLRSGNDTPYGYAVGRGTGLQGELTAGYEIARVTSARLFAQADVTLPFYHVRTEHYVQSPPVGGRYEAPTITFEDSYVPSLTVSIGIGWQRGR